MKKINLGIIGCGYWGPNLVRNFDAIDSCLVTKVADLKPGRLEFIKQRYPKIETTDDYREILKDNSIDAVCIATPVPSHHRFAKESILSGKHTFVEKPLTYSSNDADELLNLARQKNVLLMVGHIFQYAPPIKKIKEMLKNGAIGKIHCIDAARINLGPPDSEVDVVWDLAVHDVSIVLHLLEKNPVSLSAIGKNYEREKLIDAAFIKLIFPADVLVSLHVSWLSAAKTRQMRLFGSSATIIYDDLSSEAKLKVYHQGVDSRIGAKDTDSIQLGYGAGEITTPLLENYEPLRAECEDFINCIRDGKRPLANGKIGRDVVKILEGISSSIKRNGKEILL